MRLGTICCLGVGLAGLLAVPDGAAGQTYRFTKVLTNQFTLRPDGAPFGIAYAPTTPSYDGRWVVFRDPGPNNDPGTHAVIWSYDTLDGSIHNLIDLKTPVPGGGPTFQDLQLLDTAPIVRNGVVIFVARDSSSGMSRQGLYSVPAGGGPVQTVANYSTPDPNGGTFTLFDVAGKQVGGFSFDGRTVAFTAQGDAVGSFAAPPDGSSVSLVADSLHPFASPDGTVTSFRTPVVSGDQVVLIGSDGRQPSTGYNGIYLAGVGGSGVTELLNSTLPLPGAASGSLTTFDAPVLAFDGTLVVFRAHDRSGLTGLYATDLTSHTITTIADTNSTLPGLGKLALIAFGGVALDHGAVLFKASDTGGNTALYVWKNGNATRVIGTGDQLDGLTVQDFTDPGTAAMSGSGFVFNADLGSSRGLYVASEVFANVSAASMEGGALAPASIAAGLGTGLAARSETAPSQPLPTTLADTTVTIKDSAGAERQAGLFYVRPWRINYIVPSETALGPATVTVTSAGQMTATATVNIEAVAPGLFTANEDGRGAPLADVLTVTPEGAQTSQPAALCGGVLARCAASAIDLGPAGTSTYLLLYGTGLRGLSSLASVTATIGGVDAPVFDVSANPDYAGLDTVLLLVPAELAGRGDVDVLLTVEGKPANTVQIKIQ